MESEQEVRNEILLMVLTKVHGTAYFISCIRMYVFRCVLEMRGCYVSTMGEK